MKRCGPIGCSYVTNSACVPNTTNTEASIAVAVSNQQCNSTCTTSSDARCTAASLKALLSKGINGQGNSIKAAYCTDRYLVVISNGLPNHNDTLAYIQRPVSYYLYLLICKVF